MPPWCMRLPMRASSKNIRRRSPSRACCGKQPLDGDTTFEAAMSGGNGLDHLGHATARDGSDEAVTLGRVHGRAC